MSIRKIPTRLPALSLQLLALAVLLLATTSGGALAAGGGPDTTAPVVTGGLVRTVLWPPTRGLVPVGLTGSAVDDCDGSVDVTVTVYSDEDNGTAPYAPDATGTTGIAASMTLRAERLFSLAGGNKGRAYVISLTATDAAANTGHLCFCSVCPIYPIGSFILGTQAEAAAGVALCNANNGVIPPAMGWFPIFTFTLPPPIKAASDTYDCIGNCRLTVPAVSGVLANDSTIDPPLTITTAGAFASANLGDVVLAGDGSFTYDPPPGFTGADTFTYGIMDAVGRTATGNVTITVAEMIWFIDNTAASGGDGRQATPFDSILDYSTTAADSAGDVIHVDRGDGTTTDYSTGLGLLANQELYGEGVSLAGEVSFPIPPFNTLPGAGVRPVITNSSGSAITTAGGNTIRGLDISGPTGSGIFATGAGLTCSDVSVTSPGVDGITFSSVSGTVDVDNVDVTSSTANGINLVSCTASFTFDSLCSVGNAAGVDFRVSGGTCACTYDGDLSQSTTGGLVSVIGGHGTGTILFQNGTVGCTNGTGILLGPCSSNITFSNAMSLTTDNGGVGAGIDILNATGTMTFSNLTINEANSDGIRTFASGTVNVSGTNNITTPSGAALNLSSTNVAMTFNNLTASSPPGSGIFLGAVTGSLNVTGTTDIDSTFFNGIHIDVCPSLDIDFATLDIDSGASDGIDIDGGVGDFDVSGQTTIDGFGEWGIRIANCAGDTFTFADTDIGLTTANLEGVSLTASAGATFTFADLDITNSVGTGLLCDTAGTLDVTGSPAINSTNGPAIDIENTNGSINGTGNFTFASPVSTNSSTTGIRFDTTGEVILLTDVDIDSNSPLIDRGVEFTDCTGTSKTVRRGHIIFTGTNDGHGVFANNSDNVTVEGDSTSSFDPIGTPGVFTGAFEITGMGTGSFNETLNGNTHGHHAVTSHDSNGLTVDRCYIHDIGDVGNVDASLDVGIYIDETTGGTVNITRNHFEDIIGGDAVHLGSPASEFTGTSTFNITFNRVVGTPAATPVSTEAGIQASFDSTSAATIIGNFDDNEFEGMGFNGMQINVDLSVTNGNTGSTSRNLFSASRNTIEDPDNDGIAFDFGDDSVSSLICDDNTFDASLNHTSFDFGPQICIEVELRHDGATHNPVLDFFCRDNTILSTNSFTVTGPTGHDGWINHGIRLQTASASSAGVGTVRSLIADNDISNVEEQSIEIQSDESNVVNAIVRDNVIDSSDSVLSSLEGVIDLDTQSDGDASDLVVWLDGNETGSPNAGGVDVGYRIEEDAAGNPHMSLACEAGCPVSGTITSNTDLISLLSHNGNTSDTGGSPTVDADAGSVLVVTTASVPAPSLLATAEAKRRVGAVLEDKAQVEPLLQAAKLRWIESGLSRNEASLLRSISIGLADLEDAEVGRTWITHITLDRTAAGHGWFLDPDSDRKTDAHVPAGCMDLLTVLMHEIGHVLGRGHCTCGSHLMHHRLKPGERRLP